MRLLILFLFLFSLRAFAATLNIPEYGDRIEVTMNTNDGNILTTNGTLISGLATNNVVVSTTKMTLTVTSPAYTSMGASTTVQRLIYLTKQRRMTYPNHNGTNEIYAIGSDAIMARGAISDFIFSADTITASALAGYYQVTNGATNTIAFTNLVVTNGSTLNYADHSEPSFNWAHPGQQRWTNATEYLWLRGGHWSGIAGVQVQTKDQNGNTNTVWAERLLTSPGLGRAKEYWRAAVSTTTFTNFDRLRSDFIIYPKVGNATFDTRNDRWTGLTPLPTAITNFLDRSNQFNGIAVVELGSSDSTGVITNVDPASVGSGHYFGTVKAAFNRLSQTNWLRVSIAEPIGTVYVKLGVTNWTGASVSVSNTPRSWSIIQNYPGHYVTFTNYTDQDIADVVAFRGDTANGGGILLGHLNLSGAATPLSNIGRTWLDNIDLRSDSTLFANNCNLVTITDCRVTRFDQGFEAFSTQDTSFGLVRDTDIGGMNGDFTFYTAIGIVARNTALTNNSITIQNSKTAFGTPVPAHSILVDSEFWCMGNPSAPVELNGNQPQRHGMWIENVLIEGITNTASCTLCANSSQSTTNVVFKNVTIRGPRNQHFYALSGTVQRKTCRDYNCIFDVPGFADDKSESNSAYTNGVTYHVGSRGNVYLVTTNNPTHGTPDFSGLNTYNPGNSQSPTNYVGHVNLQAYYGTGGPGRMPGLGNYRLVPGNTVFDLIQEDQGGWDVEGWPRIAESPGAYEFIQYKARLRGKSVLR